MAKIPKKPKMPKANASVTAWQNYAKRMEDWKKKVKEKMRPKVEKEKIKRKYQGITASSLK